MCVINRFQHGSELIISVVNFDPLGKVGTFPAEKIPMLRALAKKYGLKWGGDFKSRPDDMHFEVEVSATKAKELIKKLGLQDAK